MGFGRKEFARKSGEDVEEDIEGAEGKGSGVFSGEIAPIAMLGLKRGCRRRVCAAFVVFFLECWKVSIASAMNS